MSHNSVSKDLFLQVHHIVSSWRSNLRRQEVYRAATIVNRFIRRMLDDLILWVPDVWGNPTDNEYRQGRFRIYKIRMALQNIYRTLGTDSE